MASLTSSATAPVTFALLLGLVAGCAHSGRTGAGDPEAATQQDPPGQGVTSEDIQRDPSVPIEKVLMSRVPGVWVERTPDGGIAVRIRGATSIHGSNQPLYILDGVPFQPGPNGSLTGVNPYDIESIEVLKNAADTSMYGMRGANGVIIIKTKRADRGS